MRMLSVNFSLLLLFLYFNGGFSFGILQLVQDLNRGSSGSNPAYLYVWQNQLFFGATNGDSNGNEPFRYTGAGSITLAADVRNGKSSSNPKHFVALNSTGLSLYFQADGGGSSKVELYQLVQSGLAFAFSRAQELNYRTKSPSSGSPTSIYPFNASLLVMSASVSVQTSYSDSATVDGPELVIWNYNTTAPTRVNLNMNPRGASNPGCFINYRGEVFFQGLANSSYGYELYRGLNPPVLVRDINPGSPSSSPCDFTIYDDVLYFTATTAFQGRELWKFTGVGDPVLVADINPGTSSAFSTSTTLTSPQPRNWFVVWNQTMYFTANDGSHGAELMRYDESVDRISVAADVCPGSASSSPKYTTVFDDRLYFQATGCLPTNLGAELYSYDGVISLLEVDISVGSSSSTPAYITAFNGSLFFAATTSTYGTELYRYTPYPDVPLAPANLVLLAINATSVNASWLPPFSEASILAYNLSRDNGNMGGWSSVYNGSAARATVSGLQPATDYQFRVAARNIAGQGQVSSVAVVTTPALPGAPNVLPAVEYMRSNATSIQVSWLAASPGPIRNYTLLICTGTFFGDKCTSPFTTAYMGLARNTSIGMLMPISFYGFRVRSTNAVGNSLLSPLVMFKTTALPGAPSTPQPPMFLGATTHSITIRWVPPSDNGQRIVNYTIMVVEAATDSMPSPTFRIIPNITTYTITNMTAYTLYGFAVAAANRIGSSDFSAISEFQSGSDVPDAPEWVDTSLNAGMDTIYLEWLQPDANGFSILYYELSYAPPGQNFTVIFQDFGGSFEVQGLDVFTVYRFRIRAYNQLGFGPFSSIQSYETQGCDESTAPGLTFDRCGVCGGDGLDCVCGDGEVFPGVTSLGDPIEECDDNNTRSGDGCSSSCHVEPGWTCYEAASGQSVCSAVCGDALIIAPEKCDDGNTFNGDGCSSACVTEVGWNCTNFTVGFGSTCVPRCGDGYVVGVPALEECDDGNRNNGDGCSGACRIEIGFLCMPSNGTHSRSVCTRATTSTGTTSTGTTSTGTTSTGTTSTGTTSTGTTSTGTSSTGTTSTGTTSTGTTSTGTTSTGTTSTGTTSTGTSSTGTTSTGTTSTGTSSTGTTSTGTTSTGTTSSGTTGTTATGTTSTGTSSTGTTSTGTTSTGTTSTGTTSTGASSTGTTFTGTTSTGTSSTGSMVIDATPTGTASTSTTWTSELASTGSSTTGKMSTGLWSAGTASTGEMSLGTSPTGATFSDISSTGSPSSGATSTGISSSGTASTGTASTGNALIDSAIGATGTGATSIGTADGMTSTITASSGTALADTDLTGASFTRTTGSTPTGSVSTTESVTSQTASVGTASLWSSSSEASLSGAATIGDASTGITSIGMHSTDVATGTGTSSFRVTSTGTSSTGTTVAETGSTGTTSSGTAIDTTATGTTVIGTAPPTGAASSDTSSGTASIWSTGSDLSGAVTSGSVADTANSPGSFGTGTASMGAESTGMMSITGTTGTASTGGTPSGATGSTGRRPTGAAPTSTLQTGDIATGALSGSPTEATSAVTSAVATTLTGAVPDSGVSAAAAGSSGTTAFASEFSGLSGAIDTGLTAAALAATGTGSSGTSGTMLSSPTGTQSTGRLSTASPGADVTDGLASTGIVPRTSLSGSSAATYDSSGHSFAADSADSTLSGSTSSFETSTSTADQITSGDTGANEMPSTGFRSGGSTGTASSGAVSSGVKSAATVSAGTWLGSGTAAAAVTEDPVASSETTGMAAATTGSPGVLSTGSISVTSATGYADTVDGATSASTSGDRALRYSTASPLRLSSTDSSASVPFESTALSLSSGRPEVASAASTGALAGPTTTSEASRSVDTSGLSTHDAAGTSGPAAPTATSGSTSTYNPVDVPTASSADMSGAFTATHSSFADTSAVTSDVTTRRSVDPASSTDRSSAPQFSSAHTELSIVSSGATSADSDGLAAVATSASGATHFWTSASAGTSVATGSSSVVDVRGPSSGAISGTASESLSTGAPPDGETPSSSGSLRSTGWSDISGSSGSVTTAADEAVAVSSTGARDVATATGASSGSFGSTDAHARSTSGALLSAGSSAGTGSLTGVQADVWTTSLTSIASTGDSTVTTQRSQPDTSSSGSDLTASATGLLLSTDSLSQGATSDRDGVTSGHRGIATTAVDIFDDTTSRGRRTSSDSGSGVPSTADATAVSTSGGAATVDFSTTSGAAETSDAGPDTVELTGVTSTGEVDLSTTSGAAETSDAGADTTGSAGLTSTSAVDHSTGLLSTHLATGVGGWTSAAPVGIVTSQPSYASGTGSDMHNPSSGVMDGSTGRTGSTYAPMSASSRPADLPAATSLAPDGTGAATAAASASSATAESSGAVTTLSSMTAAAAGTLGDVASTGVSAISRGVTFDGSTGAAASVSGDYPSASSGFRAATSSSTAAPATTWRAIVPPASVTTSAPGVPGVTGAVDATAFGRATAVPFTSSRSTMWTVTSLTSEPGTFGSTSGSITWGSPDTTGSFRLSGSGGSGDVAGRVSAPVVVIRGRQLIVNWTAPSEERKRAVLHGLNVTLQSAVNTTGSLHWSPIWTATGDFVCVVELERLQPATVYLFRIVVELLDGSVTVSDSVAILTPPDSSADTQGGNIQDDTPAATETEGASGGLSLVAIIVAVVVVAVVAAVVVAGLFLRAKRRRRRLRAVEPAAETIGTSNSDVAASERGTESPVSGDGSVDPLATADYVAILPSAEEVSLETAASAVRTKSAVKIQRTWRNFKTVREARAQLKALSDLRKRSRRTQLPPLSDAHALPGPRHLEPLLKPLPSALDKLALPPSRAALTPAWSPAAPATDVSDAGDSQGSDGAERGRKHRKRLPAFIPELSEAVSSSSTAGVVPAGATAEATLLVSQSPSDANVDTAQSTDVATQVTDAASVLAVEQSDDASVPAGASPRPEEPKEVPVMDELRYLQALAGAIRDQSGEITALVGRPVTSASEAEAVASSELEIVEALRKRLEEQALRLIDVLPAAQTSLMDAELSVDCVSPLLQFQSDLARLLDLWKFEGSQLTEIRSALRSSEAESALIRFKDVQRRLKKLAYTTASDFGTVAASLDDIKDTEAEVFQRTLFSRKMKTAEDAIELFREAAAASRERSRVERLLSQNAERAQVQRRLRSFGSVHRAGPDTPADASVDAAATLERITLKPLRFRAVTYNFAEGSPDAPLPDAGRAELPPDANEPEPAVETAPLPAEQLALTAGRLPPLKPRAFLMDLPSTEEADRKPAQRSPRSPRPFQDQSGISPAERNRRLLSRLFEDTQFSDMKVDISKVATLTDAEAQRLIDELNRRNPAAVRARVQLEFGDQSDGKIELSRLRESFKLFSNERLF